MSIELTPSATACEDCRGDLVLRLAGRVVAFSSSDNQLLEWLTCRFRGFTTAEPVSWSIRIHSDGPPPPHLGSPRDVYHEPVEIGRGSAGPVIEGLSYRADFDCAEKTVCVRGPRATYPVDGVLRVLLPMLLDDGLLLHGGMLQHGNAAWIFSGPSGSGKSTLSRLLPDHARCDEMVAMRRCNGRWMAESMPFWEARPAQAPLEGLLLLEHAARNRRTPLAPGAAARALSREILWPLSDPTALAERFALFSRLLAEVPAWQLGFRPTPAVWSVITEPAA